MILLDDVAKVARDVARRDITKHGGDEKGSCDRERYPWFVAQFWTESRNRWRCRFRAADPRPRRGSAGVSRYYGAFARRAPGLAWKVCQAASQGSPARARQ